MFSSCPICHQNVLVSELEWHADNHFVGDELKRDMALAQQIALAPGSCMPQSEDLNCVMSMDIPGRISEPSTSSCNYSMSNDQEMLHLDKVSCLVSLQIKSAFYKVEGGLMSLIRRCLEMESGNSKSIISGHVDHYQSVKSEDSGWGCGWRNIQMLSSYLIMEREEARDLLFAGSGFVPDIPSLQRWLEVAWERGFDTVGSNSFNYKIYGSQSWIGTTECATLFRSFGLRARVVDFDSLPSLPPSTSDSNLRSHVSPMSCRKPTIKRVVECAYGPMDKFVYRNKPNAFRAGSCSYEKSQQAYHDSNQGKRKDRGHQVLVEWIWNYFTSEPGCRDGSMGVHISKKTPLYFQHDGHSRTIVGIQLQKGHHRLKDRYFLLVLDPSQTTTALERSLRDNTGWQKLIKRGVCTLKKPQYQLCYIDPGIANKEEMEQLKTIDSILVEF